MINKQKKGETFSIMGMQPIGLVLAALIIIFLFAFVFKTAKVAQASDTKRFDEFIDAAVELENLGDGVVDLVNVYMRKDELLVGFDPDKKIETDILKINRPTECTTGSGLCICACVEKKCERVAQCHLFESSRIKTVVAHQDVTTKDEKQNIDYKNGDDGQYLIIEGKNKGLYLELEKIGDILYVGLPSG